MMWQANPLALIPLAGTVPITLFAYTAWKRRTSLAPRLLFALFLAVNWLLVTYTLELVSVDISTMLVWVKLEFIGYAAIPSLWLLFVASFVRNERWLRRSVVWALIGYVAFTLLAVWTTDVFHLFYSGVGTIQFDGLHYFEPQPGPLRYVQWSMTYTIVFAIIWILWRAQATAAQLLRRQIRIMLGVTLFAGAMGAAEAIGSDVLLQFDTASLAYFICTLPLYFSLFRYRLFDLVPYAQDLLFKGLPDAVLVVDEQDRLIDFNPAGQLVVGRHIAETLGNPISDVLPNLRSALRDHDVQQTFETELPINVQGQVRQFDLRIVPMLSRDGDYSGRILMLRDISARKKTEEALRQSEERFHQAFMTNPAGLAISALDTGQTLDVNDSFADTVGYKRAEIIGTTTDDLNLWADDADRVRFVNTLRNQGYVRDMEICIRTKAGAMRYCLVSAGAITLEGHERLLTVIYDITDRKQAEEALRQSEERFYKAFMNSPAGLAIATIDDGICIDINDSFARMLGFTREEMIGKRASELNVWADYEERLELIRLLEQQGYVKDFEVRGRTKTGDIRDTLVSAQFIMIAGQRRLLTLSQDVTDRKRIEQQQLELHLEREKVRILRLFVSDTSHDLRTPLTVIKASSYLLEALSEKLTEQADRLSQPGEQDAVQLIQKYAGKISANSNKIQRSSERLHILFESLYEMIRLDGDVTLDFRPEDLNHLIAEAVDEAQYIADQKRIHLRFEADPALPPVSIARHQFSRVILNLVGNAMQYTLPEGAVVVKTQRVNGHAQVVVADTGIGIASEDLPRIFDRFYRADKARSTESGGMGLGLAIVKRIVEAHNGTVDVHSEVGKGTTFTVSLPINLPIATHTN